jgi:hypothetical protein
MPWKSNKYCMFCVCSFSYPACNAHAYCHPWPVWRYHIFPFYIINSMTFRNKLLNIKCVFWFSLTYFILRRTNMTINIYLSSHKIHVILVTVQWNLNFLDRFSKTAQISHFIKICPGCFTQVNGWADNVKVITTICNFVNMLNND